MKKSKILKIALFVVVLIIAVFLLLNSCHCKPFKEEWHFFSYKADMVFINGVTVNMGFSDASHAYPFAGIEHQNIGISFTKDGKVEFTPKDGVTLHGTYTYENDGVTYTSFTITLENGEIVEGSCMKTLEETKLALTYQGIVYNFTNEGQRTGTTIYDVIGRILNGDYDCLSEAEVIISGGENLYPVQIEDFLRRNNAVKDVAVIGLPDPRLGEIAAAIIEVKEGFSLTEEDVNNFFLDLPRYQRPRKIIFAEVPRNPTGKIEKPKLRKLYGADHLVAMQNEIGD